MDKKGLGKGLGALIADTWGDREAAHSREVRIDQVRPNPFQPRQVFDPEKLADLVQSVREHGILQPILLRRVAVDGYEVIAGERRLRAAKEAGLKTIPAIVKEYADPQMLEIALIENIQREDINPVEAARAYRRLNGEFGMTQQDIARRVGKSQPTIANTMRLLALPEPILESLSRGELTEAHARTLLQVAPEAQLVAWERIRNDHMSVRQAEQLAKTMQFGVPKQPIEQMRGQMPAPPDPNHAALEADLREALGTKVHVRYNNGSGRIEIEFYDDAQLEGLVQRMTRAAKGTHVA